MGESTQTQPGDLTEGEVVLRKTFIVTMIGSAMFIGVVVLFIL
jgi:hypothetical protein